MRDSSPLRCQRLSSTCPFGVNVITYWHSRWKCFRLAAINIQISFTFLLIKITFAFCRSLFYSSILSYEFCPLLSAIIFRSLSLFVAFLLLYQCFLASYVSLFCLFAIVTVWTGVSMAQSATQMIHLHLLHWLAVMSLCFSLSLLVFFSISKIKMPQHVSDFCQWQFPLPRPTIRFLHSTFITTPHIFSRTLFVCYCVPYHSVVIVAFHVIYVCLSVLCECSFFAWQQNCWPLICI